MRLLFILYYICVSGLKIGLEVIHIISNLNHRETALTVSWVSHVAEVMGLIWGNEGPVQWLNLGQVEAKWVYLVNQLITMEKRGYHCECGHYLGCYSDPLVDLPVHDIHVGLVLIKYTGLISANTKNETLRTMSIFKDSNIDRNFSRILHIIFIGLHTR